ncbi:MAG: hypothetical protein ACT4PT_01460 [Methanobacteriota archaeon]
MTRPNLPRPTGVAILAALHGIGAVFLIAAAILSARGGMVPGSSAFGGWDRYVTVLVGGLSGFAAWGLWEGRSWGLPTTAGVQAVAIVLALLAAVQGSAADVTDVLVPVAVLYYLLRPGTRRYFERPQAGAPERRTA